MVTRRARGPAPAVPGPCHPAFPAGPDAVVVAAPAKLNLFLEILRKRPDGYHDLESLMVAVDLFDTLELRVTARRHDHPRPATRRASRPGRITSSSRRRLRSCAVACEPARPRGARSASPSASRPRPAWAAARADAAVALLGLEPNLEIGADTGRTRGYRGVHWFGRGVLPRPRRPRGARPRRGRDARSRWRAPLDFVLVCPPVGLATADGVPPAGRARDARRWRFAAGARSGPVTRRPWAGRCSTGWSSRRSRLAPAGGSRFASARRAWARAGA